MWLTSRAHTAHGTRNGDERHSQKHFPHVPFLVATMLPAGTRCHGRLYARNLPLEMTEDDISQWVSSCAIPAPNSVKILKHGLDVKSCYLHYSKVTEGQLSTYCEHLSGHWLAHKPTEVSVALDMPHQRQQPGAAASWFKMVFNHHTGRGGGRGRKKSFLDYHGYLQCPQGLVRKQCECCTMPWPNCPLCFVA